MSGETIHGDEDVALLIDPDRLLANDMAGEAGRSIRLSAVLNANHGQASLTPDGDILFTPEADYHGQAGFDYVVEDDHGLQNSATATIDLASVNDLPSARGESYQAEEDTILTFTASALTANDSDIETAQADLTVAAVGNARNGTVQLLQSGEVRFTPTADFAGNAGFDYTIADRDGGEASASVDLIYTPVNDAPRLVGENATILENATRVFSTAALLANDSDPDNDHADLSVVSVQNAVNGQVSLDNGLVTYTPDFNFIGYGSFTYAVSDGAGGLSIAGVAVNVIPPNQNPVVNSEQVSSKRANSVSFNAAQLLANDWDPDGDAIAINWVGSASNGSVWQSGNSITFNPVAGSGDLQAGFSYQVVDGRGGYAYGNVSMSLQANRAPVAVDDGFTGYEDVLMRIPVANLLANDSDVDNLHTDLRIVNLGGAQNLLSLNLQGNEVLVQAVPDFSGQASFDYEVSDGQGGSAVARAYLNILPVNDAPMIVSSSRTAESTQIYFGLDDNGNLIAQTMYYRDINGWITARDPDGASAALTYELVDRGDHAHENWVDSRNGVGVWRYESEQNDPYTGPDSFTIKITDQGGASTFQTINVTHYGKGQPTLSLSYPPVVLDLDGDGLEFVGLTDSAAYFDVDGDGKREHLAWVTGGDALLALDTDGDRIIDKSEEISFTSYLPGARSDLEGLLAFDSNGDGKLDAQDERWNDFGAWQDANGNGLGEAGELTTLDENGIVSLLLASDHRVQNLGDVTVLGTAQFERVDGSTGKVGDAVFNYEASQPILDFVGRDAFLEQETLSVATLAGTNDRPVEETANAGLHPARVTEEPAVTVSGADMAMQPSGVDAEIARMALLFTQASASEVASTTAPLGVVEMAPANDALIVQIEAPEPLVMGA